MGMFDYVDFECKCPQCGTKVDGFQSKDGDCSLSKIDFFMVDNFYSSCPKCGLLLQFTLYNRKNKKVVIDDYIFYISKTFNNLNESGGYFDNPKSHFKKEVENGTI